MKTNQNIIETVKVRYPRYSLLLLFSLLALFLIFVSTVGLFLSKIIAKPEASVRVLIVLQDVLVFMLPAVITAALATRKPATLLGVDNVPDIRQIILAVAILICAVPAMNVVITWNENLHLPQALADIEAYLKQLEDSAKATTDLLINGASVGSLIVSVLIVGVLAGVSEEIFFRGGVQRLLMATKMNRHLAVWLSAFIFSMMHFQFYGFVPRMLLGAMFGYVFLYSGSLWLSMIMHALNNSIVVVTTWMAANCPERSVDLDSIGVGLGSIADIVAVVLSLVITFSLFYYMHRVAPSRTIHFTKE